MLCIYFCFKLLPNSFIFRTRRKFKSEQNNDFSGGSRQNFDRVLIQKNLTKNDIFVHFHSNLEILTGFQKPCDPVWIRHWIFGQLVSAATLFAKFHADTRKANHWTFWPPLLEQPMKLFLTLSGPAFSVVRRARGAQKARMR